MKRFRWLIWLPVVALVMVSCKDEAVSSPGLQASSYLLRTSVDGVKDTIRLSDSIQVGDTVLMGLAAYGYYNYLTGIHAQTDTACLRLGFRWNHDDDKYIIQGSDPEHGILLFQPNQVGTCVTTLQYIALKSGTHRVEVTVSSDAGQNYSPRLFYFNVPVK